MHYSTENTFPEAVAKEAQFTMFFRNVKALTRNSTIKDTNQAWNEKDFELSETLQKKKEAVREALCDSFDTPRAVNELSNLVVATNSYLAQQPEHIKLPLVKTVSKYVFFVLKAFGVYEEDDTPMLADGEGVDTETAITPLMNVLAKFRDEVKKQANDGTKARY